MPYIKLFILLLVANISFAQNNSNNAKLVNCIILDASNTSEIKELPDNFCDSSVNQIQISTNVIITKPTENISLKFNIVKKSKAATLVYDTTIIIDTKLFTEQNDAYNIKSKFIDVTTVNTGNYLITVSLLNNSKIIDSTTILLQRWNSKFVMPALPKLSADSTAIIPMQADGMVDVKKTFVAKYPANTLVSFLKALMPIAGSTEEKVLSKLLTQKNDTLNRQFFYNFWQSRNKSNPQKEWETYAQKLNYAASNFGTAGIPGYSTDRGRIYLKYGEPHKFETVSNEEGALPYEVWQYDAILNGKEITFLFVQSGNMGSQLTLLHSTMPGELYNPYWINTLIRDASKTDYRIYNYIQPPSAINNK